MTKVMGCMTSKNDVFTLMSILNGHAFFEIVNQYTPIFANFHELVYNSGFSNFELPLLIQNSIYYVAQILSGLSYTV